MINSDTGILLNETNIKLHRQYFNQMIKLLGINVLYRAPRENSKAYNGYGELDTFYTEPIVVGCIWDEHPSQKTYKKLGWVTETNDTLSVIHVPYNLKGLQKGALFIIPSGLDNSEGRVFRVERMSNIAVYPCSISCEIGPLWINTNTQTSTTDFTQSNMNLLDDESEEYGY